MGNCHSRQVNDDLKEKSIPVEKYIKLADRFDRYVHDMNDHLTSLDQTIAFFTNHIQEQDAQIWNLKHELEYTRNHHKFTEVVDDWEESERMKERRVENGNKCQPIRVLPTQTLLRVRPLGSETLI